MKADRIIKNAKIFTADKDNLHATALVVKDGKFIYVGDDAGLSAYEYLYWTPQAHRFFELRNHATARMLGAEKDMKESDEAKAFKELLLKYNLEQ